MRRASLAVVVGTLAAAALLYAPLLAVVVASFNASRTGLRWTGFTTRWYARLFETDRVGEYLRNTLVLAGSSTLIATVLGTMLAIGLARRGWRRRTRAAIDAGLQIPVVTPDILFAVGLIMAFAVLRTISPAFEPGMLTMVLGHASFQIAFVALVVGARLAAIGPEIEDAARDLYASGWNLARRVTIPLLWPGIAGGAMLAFTLSLDDFVISFMTGGPRSTTLPVWIYASVRRGVSPELHALSAILLAATAVLVLAVQRLNAGGASRSPHA